MSPRGFGIPLEELREDKGLQAITKALGVKVGRLLE